MLKSHVKFHSTAGKRLVLIVDDEQVNRELLGFIVSSDFDVLYAASGEEAIQVLKENAQHISLVLLDLMMPGMDGFDVMRIMRNDPKYERIPILVLTNEESAEVESLRLGASDFIKKPFRNSEVIIARMQKAIELFEDRHIIESTEREPLTGLFIKNYFYRYAEQYDQYHGDVPMDAIALDISHFHLINEMYGRDAGDGVLKHLGAFLKEVIARTNGMACRLEADKFAVIMVHMTSALKNMVRDKIQAVSEALQNTKGMPTRVTLSVGVAFSDRKNPGGDILHDADTALYRVKEAGRNGCAIYE